MRIFQTDGKTNFVDKNDVYVGFDAWQSCCESFGHFFMRSEPTLKEDVDEPNAAPFTAEELEPFFFAHDYFKESGYDWGGGAAAFKLTNGAEEIYLVIYNHHNGYYSHGFEMKVGGEIRQEGCI